MPWIGTMNIDISKTMLTKLLADGHLTLDAVTEIPKESKKIWHTALLESICYDETRNSKIKSNGSSDH